MGKALDYNATIVQRRDLSDLLAIFDVELDEQPGSKPMPGKPWFIPGQYTTIGLNNRRIPELGGVRRAMSIASAPSLIGKYEFYIRKVSYPTSDNPLTPLMWEQQAGARIYCRPTATGHFTIEHALSDSDTRLKVCVAAGTGLAPFLSMARDHAETEQDSRLGEYAIVHGASYPNELGYTEELKELQLQGLKYVPTVSRPKEALGWQGSTGRAEDQFKAENLAELEDKLGLSPGGFTPENVVVFVCGLQGTIGYSIERLLGRGFVPDNRKLRRGLEIRESVAPSLFYEQYDSTPVMNVNDRDERARLLSLRSAEIAA